MLGAPEPLAARHSRADFDSGVPQNALDPSVAWSFYTYSGQQQGFSGVDLNEFFAMAVRDGDVAAVPETGTYALMLAGLAALAFARRQLRR